MQSLENPESLRRLPKGEISKFEELRNQMIQAMKVEDDDEASEQRPSYPIKDQKNQSPGTDSEWMTCSNDRSEVKNGMSTSSRPTRLSRTAGPLKHAVQKQEISES